MRPTDATGPERALAAASRRGRGKGKEPTLQRVRAAMELEVKRPPKPSQRWRLIQAMIELSAEAGHSEVTVAKLCAGAGVSPATFYVEFGDKEALLVAAYRHCAERVFGPMRSVLVGGELAEIPARALSAMFEEIADDPDAGRIVFVEALGGGERMLYERKHAFERFERRVQEYLERVPREAIALDIPVVAVAGALRHIVSRHLRTRSEDQLPALVDKGLGWLFRYARASCEEHWSTSPAAFLTPDVEPSAPVPLAAMPEPLPRGRHGLSPGTIARSQRTRLLLATAEVTMERGYATATVDEIVARAKVAKPAFYDYFSDKQHAFLEAQQYPTQFILDRCGEAYFSGEEWPQRLWKMLEVLLSLIAANPAISHLRLVECYSAGPEAIRRAEEITRSFTIFIEEGYRYRPQADKLPRLCSQAITGAIFEIVQRQIAQGQTAGLHAYVPQLAYIALAPFTGADEAIRLVEALKSRRGA